MKKKKAIICDIDGTLADISHRSGFVGGKKKDWKSFLSDDNVSQDAFNKWCFNLCQLYYNAGYTIIFCSGRNERLRSTTHSWIDKGFESLYNKPLWEYQLLMRKDSDFREDTVIKTELYKEFIEPKYDVEFVVDDRKSVVVGWRKLGLTVLQCAEGDY